MTIDELFAIIEDRKKNKPGNSYISSLFLKKNDRIIQKVGEEAIEVVIAAKNKDKDKVIAEVADLWFHMLILLSVLDIKPEEVFKELEKRKNHSRVLTK